MESSVKERTIEFVKNQKITMKEFETRCGLSTGYVTSMRKGYGADKLNNVLKAFPQLNRDWLLYGEGSMLTDPATAPAASSSTDLSSALNKAMDEIAAQRRITEKSQQQIDRLISLLEADRRTSAASPTAAAPEEGTEAPRKRA
jgi:hypothetical protein|nr:MAG TPA: repressor protein CI [Caudoviricetes sp.]